MTTLDGKVAVVLGASAEGGIGWIVAETLAAQGARVVVSARRKEQLNQLAEKIGGLAVVCDGADGGQIAALARAAATAFGQIDIAVNAAGQPVTGSISSLSEEAIQKSLSINYIGQVYFVRHMAAVMTAGGSITLISSAASTQPVNGRFAYGCAKAAMDSLVRYAAIEYGPRGIRINSILPGLIRTKMAAPVLAIEGAEKAFVREIPLGRIGVPQDCADVVTWLSGPGYITGVNLPVSGGGHLTRLPRPDEILPRTAEV